MSTQFKLYPVDFTMGTPQTPSGPPLGLHQSPKDAPEVPDALQSNPEEAQKRPKDAHVAPSRGSNPNSTR